MKREINKLKIGEDRSFLTQTDDVLLCKTNEKMVQTYRFPKSGNVNLVVLKRRDMLTQIRCESLQAAGLLGRDWREVWMRPVEAIRVVLLT